MFAALDNGVGLSVSATFPNLKLVAWFDVIKPELAFDGRVVDWSVSTDPSIAAAFAAYVTGADGSNGGGQNYWASLKDVASLQ